VTEPFWNLTGGVRPPEPAPGLYADICRQTRHVFDEHYGPGVCARCGHRIVRVSRRRRRLRFWRSGR
jgi:hypothetical protein